MKLIVAGSRSIDTEADHELMAEWLDRYLIEITPNNLEIVSGLAKGPDLFGKWYGEYREIPVKEFPADWENLGRGAGFRRNELMAEYADELIAFWDGKSKGTRHMIGCMLGQGKPFQVILVR